MATVNDLTGFYQRDPGVIEHDKLMDKYRNLTNELDALKKTAENFYSYKVLGDSEINECKKICNTHGAMIAELHQGLKRLKEQSDFMENECTKRLNELSIAVNSLADYICQNEDIESPGELQYYDPVLDLPWGTDEVNIHHADLIRILEKNPQILNNLGISVHNNDPEPICVGLMKTEKGRGILKEMEICGYNYNPDKLLTFLSKFKDDLVEAIEINNKYPEIQRLLPLKEQLDLEHTYREKVFSTPTTMEMPNA